MLRWIFVVIAVTWCAPAVADDCDWCGCRGGPGYRSESGKCVGRAELKKVCGSPPSTRCSYEGNRDGPVESSTLVDTGTAPDLSAADAEMRRLLDQFDGFKDSEEFRDKGFLGGGAIRTWRGDLETLKGNRAYASALMDRCDLLPGDLWLLAIDYMKQNERDAAQEKLAQWKNCFDKPPLR